MGEIDLRIEGLADSEDAIDPDDLVTETESGPPVSQGGDLWLLGHHRLLCGSALDEAAFDTVMAGEVAAMAFTDPPFNVPIAGHASGLGAIKHPDFIMAAGEMSEAQFTAFLGDSLTLSAKHTIAGGVLFVCMDHRHLGEMLAAGKAAGATMLNLCVWVKDNGGMGSLYRSQHELVFAFKNGSGPHRNNVQLGKFGRNRTNVWSYPGANSFARTTGEGNLLALHPTVKPVALCVVASELIAASSGIGYLIMDARQMSQTDVVLVGMITIGAMGKLLDTLLKAIEHRLITWKTTFSGH